MYDEELEFDFHPMMKRDLAVLYAENLTPRAAVNRLRCWIERNPALLEELLANGYRKTSRLLTAMQVRIIVKHLGEP